MSGLIHIVYLSYSEKELSESELNEFLATIRRKNELRNITGLLLYNHEAFIQVIEGKKETIHRLFEITSKDSRHSNIIKLLEESINERTFPDWSMGFPKLNDANKASIIGYSSFMQNDKSDFDYSRCAESVRHLSTSFKKHT